MASRPEKHADACRVDSSVTHLIERHPCIMKTLCLVCALEFLMAASISVNPLSAREVISISSSANSVSTLSLARSVSEHWGQIGRPVLLKNSVSIPQ